MLMRLRRIRGRTVPTYSFKRRVQRRARSERSFAQRWFSERSACYLAAAEALQGKLQKLNVF